jgi:hypothetical protein
MPTNIGTSTSYQAQAPSLSEVADIQVALRLLGYGTSSEPANDAGISANSVFGKIRDLTTSKANLASPTFTGTVTLTAGTTTVAPLRIGQSSQANLLTTPLANAIESSVEGFYATVANGPGRGLINARQMVFSLDNSSAATTNTAVNVFAAANDILSSLEVAKLYRFKGTYYANATFTSGTADIQLLFAFSNAPTAIKYNFKTYKSSGSTMDQVGIISAATASNVSADVTATATYAIEFEGYFTSNAASVSTFTPQFQMSATGSSTVMQAGSWLEIEKLGSSTQTRIAGNWA